MRANYEVNSPKIFLEDDGAELKQAIRSIQNAFKKLLWNLKRIIYIDFLTN